jgi:hypothetical protein
MRAIAAHGKEGVAFVARERAEKLFALPRFVFAAALT